MADHRALNERNFFALATFLVLALLLVGFSRSFYLLPFLSGSPTYAALEPIFYVHGAVFTAWYLLLGAQTLLVRTRNIKIHRTLGLISMGLAALVVVFGAYVALVAANRPTGFVAVPLPPHVFLIVPLSGIVFFAVFATLGYLNRHNAPAHKRYMFLASVTLLGAALARIPLMFGGFVPNFETYVTALLIVMLGGWDFASMRRVHPVTLWGGLSMIVFQFIQIPLAMTDAWQGVALWMMSLVQYG